MCQKVYEIVHFGLPWSKNLAKGEGKKKIINLFNFFACKLLHPPFTYPWLWSIKMLLFDPNHKKNDFGLDSLIFGWAWFSSTFFLSTMLVTLSEIPFQSFFFFAGLLSLWKAQNLIVKNTDPACFGLEVTPTKLGGPQFSKK